LSSISLKDQTPTNVCNDILKNKTITVSLSLPGVIFFLISQFREKLAYLIDTGEWIHRGQKSFIFTTRNKTIYTSSLLVTELYYLRTHSSRIWQQNKSLFLSQLVIFIYSNDIKELYIYRIVSITISFWFLYSLYLHLACKYIYIYFLYISMKSWLVKTKENKTKPKPFRSNLAIYIYIRLKTLAVSCNNVVKTKGDQFFFFFEIR